MIKIALNKVFYSTMPLNTLKFIFKNKAWLPTKSIMPFVKTHSITKFCHRPTIKGSTRNRQYYSTKS